MINRSSKPELGRGEFQALLDRLGSNPLEAAYHYERLRSKMIQLFVWERCTEAEELADDCFDRVARKLEDGIEIHSIPAFLAAVARVVVKEYRSKKQREFTVLEQFRLRNDAPAADAEQAAAQLEACLSRFLPKQRTLLLQYYEGDHSQRIANRKRLAEKLGIHTNALRNRAMRLRYLLEACMGGSSAASHDGSGSGATID